MSRIKEVRRQLEAAGEAIEALDVDLSAGRLHVDEHSRQRAEREREAGRLFVSLRRAQREARERPADEPTTTAGPRPRWLRSPLAMVPAAVLLVVVGIGAGVAGVRWFAGPRAGAPASAPSSAVAAREDAPIPSLLQFAHVELDQGRLDEARRAYGWVLAREPRNVEAITHLGSALFKEGRTDEALAKVEEALRIDPRYIHAHWDRTEYLFYGKRDFPAAIKAAEAFLQVVPDGPDADTVRKLMAEARQQTGKGR